MAKSTTTCSRCLSEHVGAPAGNSSSFGVTAVLHVLYSGLGGHASLVFPLLAAAGEATGSMAFYGVEPVPQAYLRRVAEQGISTCEIRKRRGVDLAARRELLACVERLQPDAIVLHVPEALGVARAYRRRHPGCRLIAVEHHSNALKRPIEWWRSLSLLRHADRVVYLSEEYRDTVAATLGRCFDGSKSVVIGNGVDTDRFSPAERAGERSLAPLVGMCARLAPPKDIATLLKAMALSARGGAAPWRLVIAGDGVQRTTLEAQVDELMLRDRVEFLGMLDETAIIDFYRSLDVYAHSTFAETMSTAVLQALACGLPVVTSDVGGMKELVPRRVGERLPPGDERAWAKALDAMIADEIRCRSAGAAARKLAIERFSHRRCWERYRALLE